MRIVDLINRTRVHRSLHGCRDFGELVQMEEYIFPAPKISEFLWTIETGAASAVRLRNPLQHTKGTCWKQSWRHAPFSNIACRSLHLQRTDELKVIGEASRGILHGYQSTRTGATFLGGLESRSRTYIKNCTAACCDTRSKALVASISIQE